MRVWLALIMTMVSGIALATPAATVEAVQMPAWIERGSVRAPLVAGYVLESGDRIRTGPNARALLRLEEGSQVKLGASAQLDLASLSAPAEKSGVFSGVMNVVAGAFRFTTSALGASRKREIQARVSTVTIGIRGTDVWGKAETARDFVVLLEGKIDIQRQGEPAQRMETPLTIFMAPRGAPAAAVAPVNTDDLSRWAAETELTDGAGVARQNGGWVVHLAEPEDAVAADQLAMRAQNAGYAVDVEPVQVGGRELTRVSVPGLATEADAKSMRNRLAKELNLSHASVGAPQ